MSTFAVHATLIHPDHRERSMAAELLVDTGAFYSLLPAELVERLGLTAEEDYVALLANGEPAVFKLGEVRVRLGSRERTTIFAAGPPGCVPLLGAMALEEFGLAADPQHQRLVPGTFLGHL